jgi:hypothetical protein
VCVWRLCGKGNGWMDVLVDLNDVDGLIFVVLGILDVGRFGVIFCVWSWRNEM